MKKYEVKWSETRIFRYEAVVFANSPEEAVEKAQAHDIDEDAGELVFESDSGYSEEVFKPDVIKEVHEND